MGLVAEEREEEKKKEKPQKEKEKEKEKEEEANEIPCLLKQNAASECGREVPTR